MTNFEGKKQSENYPEWMLHQLDMFDGNIYRVMLDANDCDGTDFYSRQSALEMIRKLNEDRLDDDEDWRWAYIKVIDAQSGKQKDIISKKSQSGE